MKEEVSTEENLAKAKEPMDISMKLHSFYKGKLEVVPKCRISSLKDFGLWSTPGIAAPCLEIKKHPNKVFEYTNKGNFVAVVSDGTRVLGLGDIGPEAALPVMEGKAISFKYLGGVDAFPVCLGTKDPDEIIQACKWLGPTFGGINLEDIAAPKCFYILEKLRGEMDIPVWHDDQQGAATAVLAGLINALKIVGKKKKEVNISMIGAGAANTGVLRLMIRYGFSPGNIIMADVNGILYKGRQGLMAPEYTGVRTLYDLTNKERRTGAIPETMKESDVCIAFSTPGPGIIKPEWVKSMADDAIVFACANPVPEIWPWEAKKAGARIVATGRSDFPNQISNLLVFPAVFRGALDVAARTITDEMCIAAAVELARLAEDKGLKEDYIIPRVDEWEIFPHEAVAFGMKAIEQGVAGITMTRDELFEKASKTIKRARDETKMLMDTGFIPKHE